MRIKRSYIISSLLILQHYLRIWRTWRILRRPSHLSASSRKKGWSLLAKRWWMQTIIKPSTFWMTIKRQRCIVLGEIFNECTCWSRDNWPDYWCGIWGYWKQYFVHWMRDLILGYMHLQNDFVENFTKLSFLYRFSDDKINHGIHIHITYSSNIFPRCIFTDFNLFYNYYIKSELHLSATSINCLCFLYYYRYLTTNSWNSSSNIIILFPYS